MERLFPPDDGTNTVYYTVSFETGSGSAVPDQKIPEGGTATRPLTSPTRDDDFYFVDWYIDEDLYDFDTPVSADITLYAKWSDKYFTVSFDTDEGSEIPDQKIGEGGGRASRPTQDPTKEGHTFIDWYSGDDFTTLFDFSTLIMSDITVYAKFVINTYTVSFNTDGVTLDNETQYIDHGDYVNEPSVTKTGYTFGGWYREEGLVNPWVFDEHTVTDHLTLHAKWTANEAIITITVAQIKDLTFNDIEGGTIYRGGVAGYDTTITFTLDDPDSYDSYQWSIDRVGAYAADGPITGTAPSFIVDAEDEEYNTPGTHAVYLYVEKDGVPYNKTIWVTIVALDVITVSFESNGGNEVASQIVVKGGTASIPDNPTKDGYGFVAWYSDSTLNMVYDFAVPVTANITLYAKWRATADTEDFGLGAVIARIFDVYDEDDWNEAKAAITNGNGNYIINIMADVTFAGNNNPTFDSATGIKVSMRGGGRTLTMDDYGTMILIGADQTVILRDLALEAYNNTYTVTMNADSAFTMRSGKIFNSRASVNRSAVLVNGGTFTMHGGEISGNNTQATAAGGVHVMSGTFTMHGGEISGNTAYRYGGGVYVDSNGTFTMNGGEISRNTTTYPSGFGGGGVAVGGGTFTMNGGEISGNTANGSGGGVYVSSGTFTMHGGTISGNTAVNGGGVAVGGGTFQIVTGTIYGTNEATVSLRNTADSGADAALYNDGTAQHGRFDANGTTWTSLGTLDTTNNTIRVTNGVNQ